MLQLTFLSPALFCHPCRTHGQDPRERTGPGTTIFEAQRIGFAACCSGSQLRTANTLHDVALPSLGRVGRVRLRGSVAQQSDMRNSYTVWLT